MGKWARALGGKIKKKGGASYGPHAYNMYNAWPPSHVDRPDRLLRFVGLMREIGRNIGGAVSPVDDPSAGFFYCIIFAYSTWLRFVEAEADKNKTK